MYALFISLLIIAASRVLIVYLHASSPSLIQKRPRLILWQAAILACGVAATIAGSIISNPLLANFTYHLIGGGMAVSLLALSVISSLRKPLPMVFVLVLILATVCVFGVFNELLEYGLENLGFGIFSFDSRDTWRDLLANCIGGMMVMSWYYIRELFP